MAGEGEGRTLVSLPRGCLPRGSLPPCAARQPGCSAKGSFQHWTDLFADHHPQHPPQTEHGHFQSWSRALCALGRVGLRSSGGPTCDTCTRGWGPGCSREAQPRTRRWPCWLGYRPCGLRSGLPVPLRAEFPRDRLPCISGTGWESQRCPFPEFFAGKM